MDRAPRLDRIALVVDDDIFVVSALAELLVEEGYEVHTASNGFSAVRRAMECQPSVILLDLVLPERSGGEVLAELRRDAAASGVAIVVVTGSPDLLTEDQLADTDGVVGKPFDVAQLIETVHRAIHHAQGRQVEVAPIVAPAHREPAARPRRPISVRRSRGRR
jgi:CheY-like chemotaxis protein